MKKLGVIMGDRVKTGIHTSIMPGIRIGSASVIGPGTVVNRDVRSGFMDKHRGKSPQT